MLNYQATMTSGYYELSSNVKLCCCCVAIVSSSTDAAVTQWFSPSVVIITTCQYSQQSSLQHIHTAPATSAASSYATYDGTTVRPAD